jgi:hypothetical protein
MFRRAVRRTMSGASIAYLASATKSSVNSRHAAPPGRSWNNSPHIVILKFALQSNQHLNGSAKKAGQRCRVVRREREEYLWHCDNPPPQAVAPIEPIQVFRNAR